MKYLQSLTNLNAYQSFRKTSIVISGWLCTVGGLVADVLQPIAPFAFYLFLFSVAGLVILTALFVFGKKEVLGALILAGIASLATGAFSLLQQGEESEERGVVASAIPAVATLQEKLGLIEKKLDSIKEDTESIRESASRIESKSDAMLQSLDTIKEGISNAGSGGLIPNPASPEDHYHNARIHELGGDYAAARRSYLEYFKSDLPKLDPHLRFIAFLKVQEGTSGARETYNEVTSRRKSSIPAYTRLLLFPAEKRKTDLKRYLFQNPNFAPAAYHLSLEYSERRLGSQTLGDKREELSHLTAFLAADERGGLLKYFIDQEWVGEWRADATERINAIEGRGESAILQNPVSISWMANNAGWNANIQIAELALDIKWNLAGVSNPTSTGLSGYNDPASGRPSPQSFFTLPRSQKSATVEIRYVDSSGTEQGPYAFPFAPQKESDDGNQRILQMTSDSWVMFRDYEGATYLYFTHLLSYRAALSKIEYGLDTETPDLVFEFPAWDGAGLAPIDGSFPPLLVIPAHTTFATVKLTYRDGSSSPIKRFNRNQ